MTQQQWLTLPGIQPDELLTIQTITESMSEKQQQQFFALYSSKRKEQQTFLILTLIGFFGFAGLQRFVKGEIAMGILYFLTAGLCFIGTIVDLININKMTSAYNYQQAIEAASMVKMTGG